MASTTLMIGSLVLFHVVLGAVDWSTRDLTQEWFNNFGIKFRATLENGGSFESILADHADDVVDCNTNKCYDNKQDLIFDLDSAFKLLSSFDPYFDVQVSSKQQVLV